MKALEAKIIVEPVDFDVPVEAAAIAFAEGMSPAILESSRAGGAYGGYSIFACDPVAEVDLVDPAAGCPWAGLAQSIGRDSPATETPAGVPFGGGWLGFAAYETGARCSRIEPQPHEGSLPRWGRFAFYDCAAVRDHAAGQWYATAVEWPGQERPAAVRLAELRSRLRRAAAIDPDVAPPPFSTRPTPNMSRAAYLRKVERAKSYIEAGDAYEINLTQAFTTRTTAAALDLYRRLRAASPSWYGAFLQYDEAAILSSSPELFVDLRDGRVITRPIKGTRARTGDPRVDANAYRALADSEKDAAELVMIVDLLRNDLGRVCNYGSVQVTEPARIEEHGTVFHQVATIEGRLSTGRSWVDLMRAAFPGGSVTGAPKIRAMQIIRELEPTPRGVYCGSIGWIGLDGNATFNIAIRTMVQQGDLVHMHAGGAIVADSDPRAEYDEIMAKLAGMMRALNCETPATEAAVRESVSAA